MPWNAERLDAWWNTVNWEAVALRYDAARGGRSEIRTEHPMARRNSPAGRSWERELSDDTGEEVVLAAYRRASDDEE